MEDARFVTYIESKPGILPAVVAEELGVSIRTVRTYVRRANASMESFAAIELRHGHGYRLVVSDRGRFEIWKLGERGSVRDAAVPQAPTDRVAYLLADLLMRTEWVKLKDLARALYVSRSTVSYDLKQVGCVIEQFGLAIERRSHYGIRITGPEMARRHCIAHFITGDIKGVGPVLHVSDIMGPWMMASRGREDAADVHEGESHRVSRAFENDGAERLLATISSCVDEATRGTPCSMSVAAHRVMVAHVAAALARTRAECAAPSVSEVDRMSLADDPALASARRLAADLEREADVELSEDEVVHIALALAGMRDPGAAAAPAPAAADWDLADAMIGRVWDALRIDLRDDLDLRADLARHAGPLAVRARYGMESAGLLLEDVRARLPLARVLAAEACTALAECPGTVPREGEASLLAPLIELACERARNVAQKLGVAVVSASGSGVTCLLEARCRRELACLVDRIYQLDARDLPQFDFTDVDLVLTTEPLSAPIPVPVYEVQRLLDYDEGASLRWELFAGRMRERAARCIDRALFLPRLNAANKDEALQALLDLVCDVREVTPDFRELVLRREATASTYLDNDAAMPHPVDAQPGEAFAAIALLERPVMWDEADREVRAVFLLSPSADDPVPGFVEMIVDLIADRHAMRTLIKGQDWETLHALIRERAAEPRRVRRAPNDRQLRGPRAPRRDVADAGRFRGGE